MDVNIQTIKDIRFYLTKELEGIYQADELRAISNIVIRSALGLTKMHQAYMNDHIVSPGQSGKIINICQELKTGRPVQYILGETIFLNCPIKVNNSTLIPRPETEELADLIISENRGFTGNIIDFGTGSGCIAVTLAVNLPQSSVIGTDISWEVLKQAAENAELNNVNILFVKDDILNPDTIPGEKAGIIVSNPPYVRNSEKSLMRKNVIDFEPHAALFVPDSDPLIFYNAILRKADGILIPGGKIYFEINEALGKSMVQLLESSGYTGVLIVRDINGKDRIIKGIKDV